jgi:hypothetical protein
VDNCLQLLPNFTFDNFKNSKFYDNQDESSFFWINKECIVGNHKFKLGLYFKESKLVQIQLYCVDTEIQNEEERKTVHDSIVKAMTKSSEHKWGTIKSVFSKRGSISLIVINYENILFK